MKWSQKGFCFIIENIYFIVRKGKGIVIPKIIHYCWFGGKKFPELIERCMKSWREKLSGYKMICWSTENFDVNICRYTKEAYEAGKYAFVSDYVRLYALYQCGGIYLDSDIEVIKTFDDLLGNEAFTGFENLHSVATCIFGSEKGNPIFKEFLEYYENKPFILKDGSYDLTPNPIPITACCVKHGLVTNGQTQNLNHIKIYAMDYFCPYNRATEERNITENTYCIHYFKGTWISEEKKQIINRRKSIIKKYGKWAGYIYYGFGVWKTEGFKKLMKEFFWSVNRKRA